ncbi:MAG: hypothetical protein O7G86_00175 [Gammaproteobacteria bacterium]|nr:hypothetical protein [Gammaproteobacteria bacterium]
MSNVEVIHRWLLFTVFAVLGTAPDTSYSAQGEGPEGPKAYKPGPVEHKQIKITLPAQEYRDNCSAEIYLRFQQRNTQARVITEIKNETCAASAGDYQLVLRINDPDGERQTLRFSEEWSRDDALLIETTKFYEIGDNVDLRSVRLKGSSCRCADEPATPEQTE